MNILYIGTPNSIHDYKWISYFSSDSDYKTYFITDKVTYNELTSDDFNMYEAANISIVSPFEEFSFVRPLRTLKQIRKLKALVKELKIDTVHALFGAPFPVWFNYLPGVKKVITTRGSDVLVMLPELKSASKIKLHLNVLYRKLLKSFHQADFITCTSTPQISELKSLNVKLNKVHLVKTGVNVDEIRNVDIDAHLPDQLKGKELVFSPRFMRPVYNFEYQIKAFHLLQKETLSKYTFVFIRGLIVSDEYYNKLINLMDEVKGFKYEVFHSLTQFEIWAITRKAKVSLMVPTSDGTPNTALEAMSAGTPLIMGNLNYNKELFEGVSLVADLAKPSDLTSKIELALVNYPNELKDKALNNVSRFGNRSVEMNKLKSLYEKL